MRRRRPPMLGLNTTWSDSTSVKTGAAKAASGSLGRHGQASWHTSARAGMTPFMMAHDPSRFDSNERPMLNHVCALCGNCAPTFELPTSRHDPSSIALPFLSVPTLRNCTFARDPLRPPFKDAHFFACQCMAHVRPHNQSKADQPPLRKRRFELKLLCNPWRTWLTNKTFLADRPKYP
jgi:hypothetical protein